jgi:hypothetical protein
MIYENDSVDRVYGGPADRSSYLPDAMADKARERWAPAGRADDGRASGPQYRGLRIGRGLLGR